MGENRRANLDGSEAEDLLLNVGGVQGIGLLPEPVNTIRGDMDDNGVVNGIDTQLFVAKLIFGCP